MARDTSSGSSRPRRADGPAPAPKPWQVKRDALIGAAAGLGTTFPGVAQWFADAANDSLAEVFLKTVVKDGMKPAAKWLVDEILLNPRFSLLRTVFLNTPPELLGVPLRVFTGFFLRKYAPHNEQLWELTDELLQETQQRLADIRSGEAAAPAATPGAAARPAQAPQGPREMTAAEILAKKPDLLRELIRLYPDEAERERVIARLHRTLNFEHEADLLLTAVTTATPFDGLVGTPRFAELGNFLGVHYPDAKDLERITAELRSRVGGLVHLTELLARVPADPPPPAAPAPPEPTAEERLLALVAAHPQLVLLLERLYPETGRRLEVLRTLQPVATAETVALLLRAPEDPQRIPDALRQQDAYRRLQDLIGSVAEDAAEAASWRALLEQRLRTAAQLQQLLPPGAGAESREDLAARLQALPSPAPEIDAALLESRMQMLQGLTPPPAAPATGAAAPAATDRPPTKAEFEARLMALPVQPRPGMDQRTFEQVLVLIEDSQSSRFMGPLKAGFDRINAIGRQVFGGTDRIGALLDEGTDFFAQAEEEFFGPTPAEEDEDEGEPPGPGVFARIGGFFQGLRNRFRRTPAEPQQPDQGGAA